MRRLVLSCLVAGALAGVPAAHADGHTFRGGCGYATMNNPTGSGALGGREVWTGVVSLRVVPTDGYPDNIPTGGAVTAWCDLRVNGVSQGIVLGPVSGDGAVAAATPIQFRAAATDVVALCTNVRTAARTEVVCPDVTTAQVVPQPLIDLIELVLAPARPVTDPAYAALIGQEDGTACAALTALAPAVDATDRPDLLHIDPATGDAFSGPYWIWDCP